ncbi:MAG: hypothetical protein Q4G44_06960 [Alcaligenaceae bacterium]|nr:hypothetical protein [Alcaligenaceae bacterium]
MKGFSSFLSLLIGLYLSLLSSAAGAFPNAYNLLGFSQVEYEVAINPCLDQAVLFERFGREALVAQEKELAKWPKGLCQNLEVARQLLTWNYYYTTLLANTERPTVIAGEISKHIKSLEACTDLSCLNRLLPRITEWVYLNIDRLPVYTDSESARRSQASLAGDPVLHPSLALRNLPLPLSGLAEGCNGTDINVLNFYTVNFSVEGRPLVLAMCKETANGAGHKQNIWLLERLDPNGSTSGLGASAGSGWREILVERGDSRLYVFTDSRTAYPTLYSRRSTGSGEQLVVYDFQASGQQYTRSTVLNLEYDTLGRAHAFMLRP